MTKNPFLNALAAMVYIAIVASMIFYGPRLAGLTDKPDTLLAPIMMISLFTLSAAVMAYLFFYQPFQLYFNGEKKRGLDLFLQTVAVFAVITILIIISLISFNF